MTRAKPKAHMSAVEMKNSGVEWLGEIPSHWDVKRLRHVVQTNPKKSERRFTMPDLEVSFLPMPAVGEQGSLDLSQIKHLAEVYESFTYFCDNDVIVAKITPCFENGKGAIVRGLENGIGFGTTELFVLRPGHDTDSEFLYYLTVSSRFRTLGTVSMQGAAGQQRVTDLFIKDYVLGLPPLAEQRAIASYLDRETAGIDRLINKTEALNALLREKRVALISQAVTKGLDAGVEMKESGVEWLGEIPSHWDVKRLGEIADITGGKRLPVGATFVDDPKVHPYIRVTDFRDSSVDQRDLRYLSPEIQQTIARYIITDKDVYISIAGSIGLVGVVPKELNGANLTENAARIAIRNDGKTYQHYLTYWLSSSHAQFEIDKRIVKTSQPKLALMRIKQIPVVLGSYEEQRAIASYLDRETAKIDALIIKNDELKALLREKRSALISAAVTGKISVPSVCSVVK